jgi:hypothetical protein
MIRNEAEFQEASKRLGDELKRFDEHRARLKEAGLGDTEIKRVIDPLESFHLQLKEEVEAYENEQTFPRKRIYTDSRYAL